MYRNLSHFNQIQGTCFCSHHLLTFFLSLEFELVCECVITYDLDFLNLPNLANPSNVSPCLGFPSCSQVTYTLQLCECEGIWEPADFCRSDSWHALMYLKSPLSLKGLPSSSIWIGLSWCCRPALCAGCGFPPEVVLFVGRWLLGYRQS